MMMFVLVGVAFSSVAVRVGYTQINIDAGWALPRRHNQTNQLVPDPRFFPDGIGGLASTLIARGFQVGGYTDRGVQQCGPSPGSKGFEALDAATFVGWNLSYVKSDDCFDSLNYATAMADYRTFSDALKAAAAAAQRPDPYFLICGCKLGVGAPDPRKVSRIACIGWLTVSRMHGWSGLGAVSA